MYKDLLTELAIENSKLVKLARKPPAKDHPFRAPINNGSTRKLKWNELSENRNSKWLNNIKKSNHTSVLYTKDFYPIEKLEEYGYWYEPC